MAKELSAKYYQNKKKDYTKKSRKMYLKRKKKESNNMGVNDIKITLTMKIKG